MAKKNSYVSVGNRNVTHVTGKMYFGEVRTYSRREESDFNFDSTDMVSVGNDPAKVVYLPVVGCIFDSGQNPAHHNAVVCNIDEPAAEVGGAAT